MQQQYILLSIYFFVKGIYLTLKVLSLICSTFSMSVTAFEYFVILHFGANLQILIFTVWIPTGICCGKNGFKIDVSLQYGPLSSLIETNECVTGQVW